MVLAYHGAGFVGWQVQPDSRTVQGEVQRALEALLGHPTPVHGSGRTDSGVHALGQVAAFDSPVPRTPRAIRDGLNAHLPPDVACVEATPAPPSFDPRRDAKRKRYRYRWLDRRARSPLHADRSWHVGRTLDAGAMHAAAQALVGTHDVATFRAAGCQAPTTVRTIPFVRVHRDELLVHLDIEGTGFLRHMVRIVAGTLTDVGLGRRGTDALGAALAARDRSAAGRTAPAHGLTLVWVRYDDDAA